MKNRISGTQTPRIIESNRMCIILHHPTDQLILIQWQESKAKNKRRNVKRLKRNELNFVKGFQFYFSFPFSSAFLLSSTMSSEAIKAITMITIIIRINEIDLSAVSYPASYLQIMHVYYIITVSNKLSSFNHNRAKLITC